MKKSSFYYLISILSLVIMFIILLIGRFWEANIPELLGIIFMIYAFPLGGVWVWICVCCLSYAEICEKREERKKKISGVCSCYGKEHICETIYQIPRRLTKRKDLKGGKNEKNNSRD